MDLQLPEAVTIRLAPIGINIEPTLAERIRQLVAPVEFRDLLPPYLQAKEACRAWMEFLEREIPDEEEWDRAVLLLLNVFTFIFDSNQVWWRALDRELAGYRSKSGRPMKLQATWFEARRRLAARLFHYGRRGTITPAKQAALVQTMRDHEFLLARDMAADKPSYRGRYVERRGTAALFLARTAENPLEFYQRAAADLEESGLLGDHSPQRTEYLVEAYLHQYELTRNADMLSAAESALDEAARRGQSTRGLSTQAGMTAISRSALAIEANDRLSAEHFASAAAQHLRRALQQPEHQSFSADYIRVNFGIALVRRATATEDAAIAEETFDEAIRELLIVDQHAADLYQNLWLPSAFSQRAELRMRRGMYDAALADAKEAIARTESSAADGAADLRHRATFTAATLRLNLAVGRGVAEEVEAAFDWWPENWVASRWLPLPPLVAAVRWLANASRDGWRERGRRIVEMVRTMSEQEECSPVSRRFALSHAGSLMLSIAKAEDDVAAFRDAYALYVDAIDADEEKAAPELFGHAGEIALRLARVEAAAGKNEAAVALLQDATTFMELAFESHQFGITGDDAHADAAIRHLQSARSLGNSTAPLLGLLGDVHFRRGRARHDLDDLRFAISLKAEARVSADADDMAGWRENLSVTANAAMQIWSITRSPNDLLTAVRAASKAAKEDEHWAWPLLQLSEIARYPENDRSTACALLPSDESDDLPRLALEGADQELIERACRVAVENRAGFERDAKFAGRQYVYTINDPHRLLNTTLIVKETPKENAKREIDTIQEFREYLAATNAPDWMKLPEPMALVESGGRAAYVMRREPGGELGAIALRMLAGGRPAEDLIALAVRFLARYHVWRGVAAFSAMKNDLPFVIRKSVNDSYAPYSRLTRSAARDLVEALERISRTDLPLVAKKDAHGENWLVTPQNQIVMLDLEAKETSRLPLLYELAQLIEDHGIVETSSVGWESRMRFVEEYLDEVEALGGNVLAGLDRPTIERLYAAFGLIRVVVLVAGTDRRAIRRRSESSVMRAKSHRGAHYRNLAALVRDLFHDSDVGRVAATIAQQLAPN